MLLLLSKKVLRVTNTALMLLNTQFDEERLQASIRSPETKRAAMAENILCCDRNSCIMYYRGCFPRFVLWVQMLSLFRAFQQRWLLVWVWDERYLVLVVANVEGISCEGLLSNKSLKFTKMYWTGSHNHQ